MCLKVSTPKIMTHNVQKNSQSLTPSAPFYLPTGEHARLPISQFPDQAPMEQKRIV